MWWDFRIVRTVVSGQNVIAIHRVFYDTAEKTSPVLIENLPASIVGVMPLSMMQDIEMMTDAWHRPTLYIPEWNSGR